MDNLISELQLHATQCAESRYPRMQTAEETIYGRAAARIEELEAVAEAAREVADDGRICDAAEMWNDSYTVLENMSDALAALDNKEGS